MWPYALVGEMKVGKEGVCISITILPPTNVRRQAVNKLWADLGPTNFLALITSTKYYVVVLY